MENKIAFLASFKSGTDKDFNCEKCKQTYSEKQRLNNRACEKIVDKPIFKMADLTFFTCPGKYNSSQHLNWFSFLNSIEKGWMKLDLEMPNRNIEALEFLKEIKDEHWIQKQKGS